MSVAPFRDQTPSTAGIVSSVADLTREIAELASAGCLVESENGTLVAHHLTGPDVSSVVVTALLTSSLTGLHSGLANRRTTGLLPTGPVIEAQLADRHVVTLALRIGEQRFGEIWLLPDSAPEVSLADLQEPVQRLAWLLAQTTEAAAPSCLAGGPLPAGLADATHLWIARVSSDASPTSLHGALRSGSALTALRCGPAVYLLAKGAPRSTSQCVLAAVETALEQARRALGCQVSAALSGATAPADLVEARLHVDAAVDAVAPDTTAHVTDLRGQLVVRALGPALSAVTAFGPDPLDLLAEYDRSKSSALVPTLRAWLDAFGDVATTTHVLGIHGNTLRYRLGRITEILGVDLRLDPHTRTAIHLQLLTQT